MDFSPATAVPRSQSAPRIAISSATTWHNSSKCNARMLGSRFTETDGPRHLARKVDTPRRAAIRSSRPEIDRKLPYLVHSVTHYHITTSPRRAFAKHPYLSPECCTSTHPRI